ncbi:hypothetical protein AMJ74_02040 [candidate division WOR_3 bacterium SM1_77]|uniref:Uncharacterized protein n=1 Tax=candidate division WOR_3 bacterium SM1_77 TaxID=1703778 RepID=A0A0S8K2L0_UNCW3|nr:MAG: hypothetical protein AMJ74_02040 [candidate division WOR_3 bacterium SM1_77]
MDKLALSMARIIRKIVAAQVQRELSEKKVGRPRKVATVEEKIVKSKVKVRKERSDKGTKRKGKALRNIRLGQLKRQSSLAEQMAE